jgi:hypothetical protein
MNFLYECGGWPLQDAAPPAGALLEAINRDFGGLDKLQAKMNAASAAVQVRSRDFHIVVMLQYLKEMVSSSVCMSVDAVMAVWIVRNTMHCCIFTSSACV